MKYNKLIRLFFVVLICVTLVGAVSAQEIEVLGEKFNIPDDLQKVDEYSSYSWSPVGEYAVDTYMREDSSLFISFSVSSINNPDQFSAEDLQDDGKPMENKTIANITGLYRVDQYGTCDFCYKHNDNLIYITYTGDINLEDVIIQDNSTGDDGGFPFNLF